MSKTNNQSPLKPCSTWTSPTVSVGLRFTGNYSGFHAEMPTSYANAGIVEHICYWLHKFSQLSLSGYVQ